MKKSLLALAALTAFAGAASAQSSVTLSGSVDAGIKRVGTATSNDWQFGGSQSGYNAFTLSGIEDLGNGSRAFFALNHRFVIGNGGVNGSTNAGGTTPFWRQSWVGLGGGFGDIRLGRMLMPLQEWNGAFDAFDTGYVASTHTGGIMATVRSTNTIYYRSPSLGGFFAHAAIAAGDNQIRGECCNYPNSAVAGTLGIPATINGERPVGFALGYNSGPVRVVVAYDKNPLDLKTVGLYGGFNAGFANIMAQFERGDTTLDEKVKRWSVSAKVPLGAVTFKVGYTRWSDEEVRKIGVGLQYDLSKRTNLYTNVGKFSGDGAQFFTASGTQLANPDGTKTRFDVGVTHAF